MNKQKLTQNTKERFLKSSITPKYAFKQTDSTAVIIKKRIQRIFQESHFILIWATFKPTSKSLISQLEKKIVVDSTGTASALKKEQLLAFLEDDKRKVANLSKSSLPKDALKTFCLNVNLPVVGTGLDLLMVTKTSLGTSQPFSEKSCYSPTTLLGQPYFLNSESGQLPKRDYVGATTTIYKKAVTTEASSLFRKGEDFEDSSLLKTSALMCQEPLDSPLKEHKSSYGPVSLQSRDFNESLRGFTRLFKTHQVAFFLNLVLEEARKQEEKWDSNQLLGAFIKSPEGAIFITSAELKQTLLLHKNLKMEPNLLVKQPFIEVLMKIKATYLKQSKWLRPLKDFIFIINYSKYKLCLNLSLASSKKLVKSNISN